MPAKQNSEIRVVLVDDHAIVLAGLRLLIDSQRGMHVVGEAIDSASARAVTASQRPDVILLDLDLGSEQGLALLPELLAIAPDTRIILLTGLRDPEIHRQAIMLGAVGLVLKQKDTSLLIRAIEKVYAGEVWLDRTMIASILNVRQHNRANASENSEQTKIASLTSRERDVIQLIGQGLKNRQVADELVISEATVRHHLTSIFAKLGVTDRSELMIYAFRHQIVQLPR